MGKEDDLIYAIGEFSKLVDIPISTLRYYDEKEILVPEIKDPSSNYRYYSEKQLFEAFYIQHLKRAGITALNDIKLLLQRKRLQDLRASLEERMRHCRAEMQKLEAQYQYAQQLYDTVEENIRAVSAEPVASASNERYHLRYFAKRQIAQKRMTTHFYSSDQFYQSYVLLSKFCEQQGLKHDGTMSMIFLDHHPRRFAGGTYEGILFFSLAPTQQQHADIGEFGGFWVCSITHVGHYRDLPAVYQALEQQIAADGLHISGDPIEEYLVYYALTLDEDHFVTRLSFPVAPPTFST